jgi:hypothetical protein
VVFFVVLDVAIILKTMQRIKLLSQIFYLRH